MSYSIDKIHLIAQVHVILLITVQWYIVMTNWTSSGQQEAICVGIALALIIRIAHPLLYSDPSALSLLPNDSAGLVLLYYCM